MNDREMVARGLFFTEAELAAVPSRRRLAQAPAPARRDPNLAAPSAQAVRDAEGPGVCAWCMEPGDVRSALVLQADHYFRHPECQEAHEEGGGAD